MAHQLNLTKGAAQLLRNILGVPDALSTLKDKFAAGVLLTTTLDALEEIPKDNAEAAAWVKQPWNEFEITNPQYDAIRNALNKLADKIPAGAPLNLLIEQVGLTPE